MDACNIYTGKTLFVGSKRELTFQALIRVSCNRTAQEKIFDYCHGVLCLYTLLELDVTQGEELDELFGTEAFGDARALPAA